MKRAFLAAIAAVAVGGVAQATIAPINPGDTVITQTVNFRIVGGNDSGPNGTNDDADLFGGGDLLNATGSFTFSYDATYMAGGYSPGIGSSVSETSDPDAFQASLTIAGNTLSVGAGDFGAVGLCLTASSSCIDANGIVVVVDTAGNGLLAGALGPVAGYDVNSQSDISTLWGGSGTQYEFEAITGGSIDILYGSQGTTPEPSTWFFLLTGLAGVATLKLRRRSTGR
ncbi:MAG TPA: PEP-CTERM sorting domain-containing protein [Bryobacteraceae bacterium]|nr:PEP-CTERM sorting domain-containing protein [Bryobacteraceae bacterium]